MPGDVHDVHRRLVWPRDQHWLACKCAYGPARLVPATYRSDTQIRRSSVMPRTPRSNSAWCTAHSASAFVISSGPCWLCQRTLGRFDPDGVAAERPVESASRTGTRRSPRSCSGRSCRGTGSGCSHGISGNPRPLVHADGSVAPVRTRETITFRDDHYPSLGYSGGLNRVSFEDLIVVPGNVDYVYRWLVRAGNQQGLADERVHGHASLVPGDIQAGYADAAVFGDAQVEQGVAEGAEG